jgi:hypothetical protein
MELLAPPRSVPTLLPRNVEDGEFLHLTGMRETHSQVREIRQAVLSHHGVPMRERRNRIRVFVHELV